MARLTVTGYGEVSVPPDEARVDLNVVARGDSPGEALSGVADRAKSLVALLDELGMPPEQRLTSGIWAHDDPSRAEPRDSRPASVDSGPLVEASQATVAASVTVTFEAEPA